MGSWFWGGRVVEAVFKNGLCKGDGGLTVDFEHLLEYAQTKDADYPGNQSHHESAGEVS